MSCSYFQTLLPEQNPKRNASGSSNNSTSGQGSSLSSDFDENESPPDEHQPSAYLRMPAPMTTAPETVNSSRLLVSDIGPWPETSDLNPDSLPQMHGPDPHGAPLGYSRVGMVAQNTDGNLPLGQVETLPSQLNHHQPRLALAPTINSG